jgi:hypothetical protein
VHTAILSSVERKEAYTITCPAGFPVKSDEGK